MSLPLRYQISNWKQLPGCESNNGRDLHIHVTEFADGSDLSGLRISVEHDRYGVLFACIVDASGSLISEIDKNIVHEFTTDRILAELAKFGYLVTYRPFENLSGSQVTFLMTLDNLQFDKIRLLTVKQQNAVDSNTVVVAFNAAINPSWLHASYVTTYDEFNKALNNGSALNVTQLSKDQHFRWDWLVNKVMNVRDILNDNAGILQYNYYGEEKRQWP